MTDIESYKKIIPFLREYNNSCDIAGRYERFIQDKSGDILLNQTAFRELTIGDELSILIRSCNFSNFFTIFDYKADRENSRIIPNYYFFETKRREDGGFIIIPETITPSRSCSHNSEKPILHKNIKLC